MRAFEPTGALMVQLQTRPLRYLGNPGFVVKVVPDASINVEREQNAVFDAE